MDKQGRLTREKEWRVGQRYQYLKGRARGGGRIFICHRVSYSVSSPGGNNRSGWVELSNPTLGIERWCPNSWRNRFIPL